jgi:hypothetical protein
MPNGYQHERDAVWGRSRLWGLVWQTGDWLYYLVLLSSVLVPLATAHLCVTQFESWGKVLRSLGIAVGVVLVGFPVGMGASVGLKWLARRQTGVD